MRDYASSTKIVNTVPSGLIVTFRPDAKPLAVTVTVTVAPALIVPPEGLRCTVPSPLDTVLDQVTGPPCAVSEIVVPPGGTPSPPPEGETASDTAWYLLTPRPRGSEAPGRSPRCRPDPAGRNGRGSCTRTDRRR